MPGLAAPAGSGGRNWFDVNSPVLLTIIAASRSLAPAGTGPPGYRIDHGMNASRPWPGTDAPATSRLRTAP